MHSVLYSIAFSVNPLLCEFLEALLVWRLWRGGAIRRYPCLCGFVCYDLVRTPALLLVHHFWIARFSSAYLATDVSALFWQFLVFCEIVRSLFLPNSALRRVAWNAFLAVEGFAFPAILALVWGQMSFASPFKSVPSVFEQYSSLCQALLLLTLAALTRYYRVTLGRNIRGVVFSLGPNLLVNAAALASYQLFRDIDIIRALEMVPAVAFTGMIAAWLWALWEYSPSPQSAVSHQAALFPRRQWTHLWETTMTSIRRGQN